MEFVKFNYKVPSKENKAFIKDILDIGKIVFNAEKKIKIIYSSEIKMSFYFDSSPNYKDDGELDHNDYRYTIRLEGEKAKLKSCLDDLLKLLPLKPSANEGPSDLFKSIENYSPTK